MFNKIISYYDNLEEDGAVTLSGILGGALMFALVILIFEYHIVEISFAIYLFTTTIFYILTGSFRYECDQYRKIALSATFLWPITITSLIVYWIGWIVINSHKNIFICCDKLHKKLQIRKPTKNIKEEQNPNSGAYRTTDKKCESCGQFKL